MRKQRLTLPRLQTHAHAQSGSLGSLALSMYKNASLRTIALFYLAFIIILSGISSVLGVIFVLDTNRAIKGLQSDNFSIPLSANVPPSTDKCSTSLSEGTCVYDIATTALSSQLVTHTPYTMGGVTFSVLNGTRGIPYGALKYFAATVNGSLFGDEKRQYCLPVLNQKLVTCTKDPALVSGSGTNRVFYDVKDAVTTFNNKTVYELTFDPNADYRKVYTATDVDEGTMTIARTEDPAEGDTTILTAQGGYSKILSSLMGDETNYYYYTAVCQMYNLTDPSYSSWKWTSLILDSGVMSIEVTGETCRAQMEKAYFPGITGFDPLPLAIEATTKILGGVDGYSKLINYNSFNSSFSQLTLSQAQQYARNNDMNLLESLLSQLYAIVQTSWTALDNATIQESHAQTTWILQRDFPHNFIIQTFWSPSACIAAVLAALIWFCSVWQAIRWLIAIRRLGDETHGWRLLQPLDLIAYSALAVGDLGPHVATAEAREAALLEGSGPVLVEYNKASLVSLSPSTSRAHAPSTLVSPISPLIGQRDEIVSKEAEEDAISRSSS